jgi:hypothetical protein
MEASRPLPVASQIIDAIVHAHLLEHSTREEGLALQDECHQLLRPGRCPAHWGAGRRPTDASPASKRSYRHGHRTMYDLETLTLLCRASGFVRVEQRRFGDSRLGPAP